MVGILGVIKQTDQEREKVETAGVKNREVLRRRSRVNSPLLRLSQPKYVGGPPD